MPIDFLAGHIFAIDKPLGWTSFDVVNKIRHSLRVNLGIKKIKVGHAGTLDPLATGVVIVCTGKATKGIQALMDHDKEYLAQVRIGETTPSYDGETQVDASYPAAHVTRELVEQTLRDKFTGDISQVPPLFSAIRIDGHRAYEYARKGKDEKEQRLEARPINISDIEVISFDPATDSKPTADLTIRVACSKGTYIRSLARDIGQALGSGAYLTGLRRTRVGDISIAQAVTVDGAIQTIAAAAPPKPETSEQNPAQP